jgi:hypothetical protein
MQPISRNASSSFEAPVLLDEASSVALRVIWISSRRFGVEHGLSRSSANLPSGCEEPEKRPREGWTNPLPCRRRNQETHVLDITSRLSKLWKRLAQYQHPSGNAETLQDQNAYCSGISSRLKPASHSQHPGIISVTHPMCAPRACRNNQVLSHTPKTVRSCRSPTLSGELHPFRTAPLKTIRRSR